MGFLNKKPVIRQEGFHPLELNQDNVQAIFNRCLATKDTPNSDIYLCKLFKKSMGYEKEDTPIAFIKSRIEENKQNVLYLLGQLKSVHDGSRMITASESIFKYDGKKWTTDNTAIGELYYLARTSNYISPFIQATNRANTEPSVKPTLSPKDPAFPAWWEAHKGEWEQ